MTEPKQIVAKGLNLPATLEKKVEVLSKIKYGHLPDTELKTLCTLIEYSQNNQLAITVDIAKMIKQQANLTDSSFSTSLYRLEKRGIITRSGKTVIITLLFKGVRELDKLVINFTNQ